VYLQIVPSKKSLTSSQNLPSTTTPVDNPQSLRDFGLNNKMNEFFIICIILWIGATMSPTPYYGSNYGMNMMNPYSRFGSSMYGGGYGLTVISNVLVYHEELYN